MDSFVVPIFVPMVDEHLERKEEVMKSQFMQYVDYSMAKQKKQKKL